MRIIRQSGLGLYTSFVELPAPEPLLVRPFLPEAAQIVDLTEGDWREHCLGQLAYCGAVTLRCSLQESALLADALTFVATNPVQSEYLSVFARTQAIRRSAGISKPTLISRRRCNDLRDTSNFQKCGNQPKSNPRTHSTDDAIGVVGSRWPARMACQSLVSNVVILDNRAAGFSSLNPDWGERELRLVEILVYLMSRGTSLGVATSFDKHNDSLIALLSESAKDASVADRLAIVQRKSLHTKGILASRGLLTGSMNLTFNGLEINDEHVIFDSTPQSIAQARLAFESYLDREA